MYLVCLALLFPIMQSEPFISLHQRKNQTNHTLANHTSHPIHILLVSYFEFFLSPSDVYLVLIG